MVAEPHQVRSADLSPYERQHLLEQRLLLKRPFESVAGLEHHRVAVPLRLGFDLHFKLGGNEQAQVDALPRLIFSRFLVLTTLCPPFASLLLC